MLQRLRLPRFPATVLAITLLSACAAPETTVAPIGAEGASQDVEAPPALPIAAPDIPSRIDVLSAELRRIDAFLELKRRTTNIKTLAETRRADIVELRVRLDLLVPQRATRREILDARLPWVRLAEETDAWSVEVSRRYNELLEQREDLRRMHAIWDATATAPRDAPLPPELARRVEEVRARLADVELRAIERRDQVALILDSLVALDDIVDQSIDRLDVIEAGILARTAQRNAPPLWRSGADEVAAGVGISDAFGAWRNSLVGYATSHPGSLAAWLLVFLGTLALLRPLQRWAKSSAAQPTRCRRRHESSCSGPVALAMSVSLMLPTVFYETPVGAVLDIVILASVLALIRIGTAVLPPRAHGTVFAISALAVIARTSSVTPTGSLFDRLELLAVTIAAILVTSSLVRRHRKEEGRSHGVTAIMAISAAAAIALAVSATANVMGWVEFARLLTEASIGSLFSAIAWLSMIVAMSEALPVLLSDWAALPLISLRRNRATVTRVLLSALAVLAVYRWSVRTLTGLGLYLPLRDWLTGALSRVYLIGSLSVSLGDILAAAMIIAATWLAARFWAFFLREELIPRLQLRRGSSSSLLSIVNYTIWGIGIALAASAAGLTGTQLAVVIGALSVGIGFGLQTIVNNFVSGLILIFERPIKVGDTLELTDYWGRVEAIGIRASTIRSFDGAEVIVPNGDLISKQVVNWTGSDEIRRAEVSVGVAYGTDPEQVLEILRRVAEENPNALDNPPPVAQMIRFGDSALEFRLRVWSPVEQWLAVISELNVAINRALADAAITIPFPQRDLHIKSDDKAES